MMASSILFLTLLGLGAAEGDAPAKRTAILDLKITGLPEEEQQALGDALSGVLASAATRSGRETITTADIRAMLSFDKQKALLGCEDDSSCLAEIGGALGADEIATGTIIQVGEAISVSLTLLDARSAQVVERFTGSAGNHGALLTTVARGAAVLFGQKKDVTGHGMLLIKTQPEGALVKVNGKDVGTAPVTLEDVPVGDHEIVAIKDNLRASTHVTIVPKAVERVELLLQTPPVEIRLTSEPPEATVLINGEAVGQTPMIQDNLPSGTHVIRFEKEGYAPQELYLELSAEAFASLGGEPFKESVVLRRQLPVGPGVATGVMADARGITDGVTYTVAVTGDLTEWLQIGAGFVVPGSLFGEVRFLPLRHPFEASAVIRSGIFQEQIVTPGIEPKWFGFIGAGLAFGLVTETDIGLFGIRMEGTWNVDLQSLSLGKGFPLQWTVPVAVVATWRYR